MNALLRSCSLALRDYWHEALISACAVLGLAAVLAPLLVLLGVHSGIIAAMTQRLTKDPRTLEITPVGSGKYGPDWFRELAQLPGVAFIIPQTRSIAATMNLRGPGSNSPDGNGPGSHSPNSNAHGAQGVSSPAALAASLAVPLAASGPGDPFLERWGAQTPGWERAAPDGRAGQPPYRALVVLSDSCARKAGAKAGDSLLARVDRVRDNRREDASVPVRVLAVLPPEAQNADSMLVPLELLVAAEEYRDGKAVPFLGWPGAPASPAGPASLDDGPEAYGDRIAEERVYASFRLYAAGLDDVAPLWRWFQNRGTEVYVKAEEIAAVQSLDRAFTVVFGLIAGAAVCGFCAATASNALAGVRRKSRSLGIMRLIGFPRAAMLLFPMVQALATGLFGVLLAFFLYLGVAFSINSLFAAALPGGEAVCALPPAYLLAVAAATLLLCALSSLGAAWQATTIEPSEVIRDV